MTTAPSGRQFELSRDEQRAVVVEVGAGIREYSVGGARCSVPIRSSSSATAPTGAADPWPNRLAGGRYSFGGEELQLALTEPEQGNAIHGLLRWRAWTAAEHVAERVVMDARLLPMPGYPFALEVTIEYRLGEDRADRDHPRAEHRRPRVPVRRRAHPYLSPGEGPIDDCTLETGAATRLVNDERQIPVGREPWRKPSTTSAAPACSPVGVSTTPSPTSNATPRAGRRAHDQPRRSAVELWVDRSYPFLEIFNRRHARPTRRRRGLGMEPMSCSPDAFNSGDGLVRLAPGGLRRA